ncbi:MAG: hypothetical protein ACLS4Z_02185 [Christensenellaceae bacterium]
MQSQQSPQSAPSQQSQSPSPARAHRTITATMPAAKEEGRASAQSSSSISCEGKREAKANSAEKIQKRVKAAYPAPKVCQRIPPVMNSAAHQRRETTAMYIRLSRRTGTVRRSINTR